MTPFRSRVLLHGAACGLLILITSTGALAQDVVRFSQSGGGGGWHDLAGVIEKEGPTGIQIKSRDKVILIPAEDILLVQYKHPELLAVDFRAAQDRISQAMMASGHQMADKIKLAREAADKLAEKAGNSVPVARYAAWQVALSRFAEAKANGKQAEAISILDRAATTTRGGWEEIPAMRMLVEQQQLLGQSTLGALEKWARIPGLSGDSKAVINNRLRLAKIREGKGREVAAELAKTDPSDQAKFALLELARLVAGPLDAVKLRQTRLAVAKITALHAREVDDNFLAGFQSTLGNYLMAQKKPEEAVWEWVRIEAQFPGEKPELGEALFHLGSLYETQLKNPKRAAECFERLKGREFAGSVWVKN